ncbi:hypothetical protein NIASO_04545 [Niabella soli DSM 19437]|uniref:Uncharacterized protein n=1 Tax=Niabella soli DSM 19437 TaxID=929713 RepID=W0F618_9BACT|nr:hypothetical protein NIASO_04545 [Niabella soli DSM 19437]
MSIRENQREIYSDYAKSEKASLSDSRLIISLRFQVNPIFNH